MSTSLVEKMEVLCCPHKTYSTLLDLVGLSEIDSFSSIPSYMHMLYKKKHIHSTTIDLFDW